ncbi:MAG: hypothetical protein MJY67_04140 [Bacteroidales bacterium]|nr:hypothetical protein [Bacteroidales bacterium]
MKRNILFITLGISIWTSCGGGARPKDPACGEEQVEDSTFVQSETRRWAWQDDTCSFYSRHWNDTRDYLMGKPSEQDIQAWKKLCETAFPAESLEIWQSQQPAESYVAFNDLIETVLNQQKPDLDFIIWRINELSPMEKAESECQAYKGLKEQFKNLTYFCPGTYIDMIQSEQLSYTFDRLMADYYYEQCSQKYPKLKDALNKEQELSKTFIDKFNNCYNTINANEYAECYSHWNEILAAVETDAIIYKQYADGIIPLYLALKEPKIYQIEKPQTLVIKDEWIEKAFVRFKRHLRSAEKKNALENDQKAWQAWVDSREEVSALLKGRAKQVYDNQTMLIRRTRFICLTDHYESFTDTGMSYSEFESLLGLDCTDEEIVERLKYGTTTELTDSLIVFCPKYSRIDLVTENIPDINDSSVVLCLAGPFTGKILNEFTHSNINGQHVCGGVYYPGFYGKSGFVWDPVKGYEFLCGDSGAELTAEFKRAAQNGGMGFTQCMLVHWSRMWENGKGPYTSKDPINTYRALCEKGDKLIVVQSRFGMRISEFTKALVRYEVRHALYCDMGYGWRWSWYREPSGEAHWIFNEPQGCDTNWITFYND